MKKLSLLVLFLLPSLAEAGNSTLVYTTAQSTAIQTRLIPRYNAEHCLAFALAPTCSSAELVSAGCVARVVRTVTIESCTIFTSNAAGELGFLQEVANQKLVSVFNQLIKTDGAAYSAAECVRFKALSPANQATECTARGLASTCDPCP